MLKIATQKALRSFALPDLYTIAFFQARDFGGTRRRFVHLGVGKVVCPRRRCCSRASHLHPPEAAFARRGRRPPIGLVQGER